MLLCFCFVSRVRAPRIHKLDGLAAASDVYKGQDEEYIVGGYDFVTRNEDGSLGPGLGGDTTLICYYGDPRTVHLTVGYRF